jgi:Ca2+-binding EF-hand superfamily protein
MNETAPHFFESSENTRHIRCSPRLRSRPDIEQRGARDLVSACTQLVAEPFALLATYETVPIPIRLKEVVMMMSRRSVAFVFLIAVAVPLLCAPAHAAPRNAVQMFDTDNDGTLDLAEVKKTAAALFAKLDPDKDGTLDTRELRGRLTAKELAAADPDKDGTLTLDEYLAVVEQRFNAANPDKDGTLDAKELKSRAGQALLRLLK